MRNLKVNLNERILNFVAASLHNKCIKVGEILSHYISEGRVRFSRAVLAINVALCSVNDE
jgi:hypothetical protein